MNQIERAIEGGARISGDEAEVRICEGALPRTEEKRASVVCQLCLGQSVSQSEEIVECGCVDGGASLLALTLAQAKPKLEPNLFNTPSQKLYRASFSIRNLLVQRVLRLNRRGRHQNSRGAARLRFFANDDLDIAVKHIQEMH